MNAPRTSDEFPADLSRRLVAGRLLRRQRFASALTLALLLLAAANLQFELGLAGRYARRVLVVVAVIMFFQLAFYAPSVGRLHAYRRLKRSRETRSSH
jgi:hypothetical protein